MQSKFWYSICRFLCDYLQVFVEVHAANGWGVSVECVVTCPGVRVPNFEGPVRGAADDDVSFHLGRPDATRVTYQRA